MSSSKSGSIKKQWHKRGFVLLMLVFALFGSACSTPPVPDQPDHASYDAAYRAYQACVQQWYPVDRASACNSISNLASTSYGSYTYDNETYGSFYHPYGKASNAGVDDSLVQAAWVNYLSALDAQTLADLQARWQTLADQADHP